MLDTKWLKVNLRTKVMVSDTKGEIIKSIVDSSVKCGKRVMANSLMCMQCGKWVHYKHAKMKKVYLTLANEFVCEDALRQ